MTSGLNYDLRLGIEMDENYFEIAEHRIKNAVQYKGLEEFWS